MTQTCHLQAKSNNSEKNERTLHLEQFFLIKQKVSFISRQTLYLGIAIFDKYWEKVKSSKDKPSAKQTQVARRVTACLWLAWKFYEVKVIPLKKLLSSISITDTQLEHLVEMESQILQKIDFDIPIAFPYLELTDSFDKKIKDKAGSVGLVSQCLGFLKEGIMHSSDFSLCPDLGSQILTLYTSRTFHDSRLKQVYGLIKQKKEKTQRKEVDI